MNKTKIRISVYSFGKHLHNIVTTEYTVDQISNMVLESRIEQENLEIVDEDNKMYIFPYVSLSNIHFVIND